MKKVVLFFAMAVLAMGCNNSGTSKNEGQADATTKGAITLPLDELLPSVEKYIDSTVVVQGYVTHTCKHSGKRCFIVGESQKASMRVEALGNIGGFNRELVGSKLNITGTLKERRLTKEYIAQMEKNVEVKKAEDGSAESCQAELTNIENMRKVMAESGKDYYSIYYMDGQDYAVVE